jgi:hypothetical protein
MTTATAALPVAPEFHGRSSLAALLRGLGLMALCTALTGGFLAEVWSAPATPPSSAAASAPVAGHV